MKKKILLFLILPFVSVGYLYGELEVSVEGKYWSIGNIMANQSTSTAGGRWTITGSTVNYQNIDIRVEASGIHTPSDTGSNGQNKFVLKGSSSSMSSPDTGLIITSEDQKLGCLGDAYPYNTYELDLYLQAPDETSDSGFMDISVVLTAKPFEPDKEEWVILNSSLSVVGTGGGEYLMWPRLQSSAATNDDNAIQWKTESTAGEPVWNNDTKRYEDECSEGDPLSMYPAFEWINELNDGDGYMGYNDWRLPKQVGTGRMLPNGELAHLYDNRAAAGLSCRSSDYWSSSEIVSSYAYGVGFSNGGVVDGVKVYGYYVRAVRSSQ